MEVAFYVLLVIGHLGLFDVLYYHTWKCALHRRPECQREVLWHTVRHLVYAAQFLIVANLRFHGAALLVLVVLYAADVYVAWADVWEETSSRREMGGLPRGEYFMHIALSLLVGIYIAFVAQSVWPDWKLPTAVVLAPPAVALPARLYMNAMGLGAVAFFVHDMMRWRRFRRQRPLAEPA